MTSSDSSSEDENWAALQSVAVSYEQVVSQQESIAEKAKKQASRRPGQFMHGRPQRDGADESDEAQQSLDLTQLKIAAMLDIRLARILAPLLDADEETAVPKKKKSKTGDDVLVSKAALVVSDEAAPCSSSGGDLGLEHSKSGSVETDKKLKKYKKDKKKEMREEEERLLTTGAGPASVEELEDASMLNGLRFFKRVAKGTPVQLSSGRKEVEQVRQPGTLARDRILGSTRYAIDAEEVDRCLPVLGSEAEPMVKSAADSAEQRKRDKKAASLAESLRRKSVDAGVVSPSTKEDKKKRKKKKIEAEVLETEKPFVPHELRMTALIGS